MGRGGPLDHPELREVEKLLDARDVAEAQRRLARVGDRAELANGVSYLTTRLLHARGRLDLAGLAGRLRELISRSPDFPEAVALLASAERGSVGARPPRTPKPEGKPEKVRSSRPPPKEPRPTDDDSIDLDGARPVIDTSAARAASWPPTPAKPQSATEQRPPSTEPPKTVRASPGAPRPASFRAEPRADELEVPHHVSMDAEILAPTSGRTFTPISGFDPFGESRGEPIFSRQASRGLDIPRLPALPQFRDNLAAPSYAPGRIEPDIDPLRSKSLLPHDAGRYSEAPSATDIVQQGMRRGSRAPRAPNAPPGGPGADPPRETVPHTPNRIRSGAPPRENTSLPTLFEIASWIDEGRHRDAIAAINRTGPDAGPEYSVLRARALAGAGYVDQAFDALQKLDATPMLEPELRAACARLFVELGDPNRGILLAKQALAAAPDHPLIRLTYALAAVRASRRRPDDSLLDQAERTLEALKGREGPLPALYQALKACIQAGIGDPERAISIAQRALGLDPKSPDALAAIAEASARLGRAHEARQAWARLHELSIEEADALARLLARHGVPITGRASPPAPEPERPIWTSIETDLVSGSRGAAIRGVEQAGHEAVRRMAKSASQSGPTAIATVAASFLTTTPVLSSFSPFDASLWSIRRLEAALDVLYGAERRPRASNDEASVVLLLGSYLGEALRIAHGGHWEGGLTEPDAARVIVGDRHLYPFRVVTARLRQGRRASIGDAIAAGLPAPGREAGRTRIGNPVAAPVPWAPRAWPKPSEIAALGRSIAKSPIGKYCEDFAEGPLDRTTSSLIALDTYLSLVAPTEAPPDTDAAWMRRIAVLAGGYVGETLRELVGGEWTFGVDSADDALGFHLTLKGTLEARPVAHVLERVSGARTSSLVDYAKTLMRRAERG
jgi:tetratricopeptide (TPR) repeat protein